MTGQCCTAVVTGLIVIIQGQAEVRQRSNDSPSYVKKANALLIKLNNPRADARPRSRK